MNNKESISEYLPEWVEQIFDPPFTHTGGFIVPDQVFISNSKTKHGDNLAYESIIKPYYDDMRKIFGESSFEVPLFFECDNDNNYGRKLVPSFDLYLNSIYLIMTHKPLLTEDYERTNAKDKFRVYKKNLINMKNGNLENVPEEFISTLTEDYKKELAIAKQSKPNFYVSMEDYLDAQIKFMTKLLVNYNNLSKIFDKKVDLKKLEQSLNLDKFYLAMTKQFIYTSKQTERLVGTVSNDFYIPIEYVEKVRKLREKTPYDLEIEVELPDGSITKYTVDAAIREVNEMRMAHPEYKYTVIESDSPVDYKDLEVATKTQKRIEEMFKDKELSAYWEIIPKSNPKKEVEKINPSKKIESIIKNPSYLTDGEKAQIILDRLTFLDNTKYFKKIYGKKKFDGYVGYMYDNGLVIFEKLFKDLNSCQPELGNATYVMTIDNFVEMSKHSKTELISYMKQGRTDVRRIIHNNKWKDNVERIIEGNDYTKDTCKKIDALLNKGEIERLNSK